MTQFLRRVLLASTIFSSLVTSSDLEVRAPAACSSGIYAQLSVLAGDALVSAYCSAVAPVTCTTPAPKIKRAALSTTTTTTTKSSSSTSTTTRSSATATTNPIRTSTQTTSQATTVTKAITITTTTKPASTTTSGNVRLSAWSSFLAQVRAVIFRLCVSDPTTHEGLCRIYDVHNHQDFDNSKQATSLQERKLNLYRPQLFQRR